MNEEQNDCGKNEPANCRSSDRATKKRAITCDQVAWLLASFGRYLPHDNKPDISQQREMLKYGLLYEVMEIVGLKFLDDSARWNGTPNSARGYDEV